MKTIGELKAQVKRYLTANTTLLSVIPGQPSDGEVLEDNIDQAILEAANNARKSAEMCHDFACCFMTATGSITSSAPFDLGAVSVEDVTYSFKTLSGVATDNLDGTYTPIRIISRQTQVGLLFKQQDLGTETYQTGYTAIVHGTKIALSPISDETVPVAVTGYVWADDYVDDTSTDWFLDRGFAYMQWATICELNHMLLKFVPRQEGTLAPPEKNRDLALESLIVVDSYSTEGGIYHDL